MAVKVAVAQLAAGLAMEALMTRTAPGAWATDGDPEVLVVLPGHVGDEALDSPGTLRDEVDVGPGGAAIGRDVEEPARGADGDAVQVGRAHAEVVGARAEAPREREAGRGDADGGADQDPVQTAVVGPPHARVREVEEHAAGRVQARGRGDDRGEEPEAHVASGRPWRATQFWKTSGGVLLRFVRMPEPCELPSTVLVLAWL